MGFAKDIVDIAKDVGKLASKLAATQIGKNAAEKALRHLLMGGKESDKDFLRLVKQLESAEIQTASADLVRKAMPRPSAQKATPKKQTTVKAAAKKAAPEKPTTSKVGGTAVKKRR